MLEEAEGDHHHQRVPVQARPGPSFEMVEPQLVTGDADLLVMGRFRGTAILAPAAFLEQTRGAAP